MHAEEFFFRNMLLDKCLHFVYHSVSLLLYLIFNFKDFGSLTLLLTSKGIQILSRVNVCCAFSERLKSLFFSLILP